MRKLILGLFFMSFAAMSVNFVDELPNGQFDGSGGWEDNYGSAGEYSVHVEILKNTIVSAYKFGEDEMVVGISFVFIAPGAFDVVFEGAVVGKGFCQPNYCEYEAIIDGAQVIEDLHFTYSPEGWPALEKNGQKQFGNVVIFWEDGLLLRNTGNNDGTPIDAPASAAVAGPEPKPEPTRPVTEPITPMIAG